jgi:hypothetical protein
VTLPHDVKYLPNSTWFLKDVTKSLESEPHVPKVLQMIVLNWQVLDRFVTDMVQRANLPNCVLHLILPRSLLQETFTASASSVLNTLLLQGRTFSGISNPRVNLPVQHTTDTTTIEKGYDGYVTMLEPDRSTYEEREYAAHGVRLFCDTQVVRFLPPCETVKPLGTAADVQLKRLRDACWCCDAKKRRDT